MHSSATLGQTCDKLKEHLFMRLTIGTDFFEVLGFILMRLTIGTDFFEVLGFIPQSFLGLKKLQATDFLTVQRSKIMTYIHDHTVHVSPIGHICILVFGLELLWLAVETHVEYH